jgi:hypothetical protein
MTFEENNIISKVTQAFIILEVNCLHVFTSVHDLSEKLSGAISGSQTRLTLKNARAMIESGTCRNDFPDSDNN